MSLHKSILVLLCIISMRSFALNKDSLADRARVLLQEHENLLKEKDYAGALAKYMSYFNLSDTLAGMNKVEEKEKEQEKQEYEERKHLREAEVLRKGKVVEAERRKNKIVLALIGTVAVLLVSFLVFVFRSLRKLKYQKIILEKKSLETETQKNIIKERNKDLQESLHYAKRIQISFMPSDNYMNKMIRK